MGDRVKFCGLGLGSSRSILSLRETYIQNTTLLSLVPGGGRWWAVLESHFSVQLKPKPN